MGYSNRALGKENRKREKIERVLLEIRVEWLTVKGEKKTF